MREDTLNTSELKNGKRQKLVEAAIDEFNEYGIENASYNRIIERSGLSKGSVYYHFDNKDALLGIVMEEIGERVLNAIPEKNMPENKDDFWDFLWDYRQREFDFFAGHPRLGRILIMSLGISERTIREIKESCVPLAKLIDRQINLIKTGQKLGALRDDLKVEIIFSLMKSIDKSLCVSFFGSDAEEVEKLSIDERHERSARYTALFKDLVRRMLKPV